MWVLLQFISGSIQKNALGDFLPVMKLFDLLYPEKEVSCHLKYFTIITYGSLLTLYPRDKTNHFPSGDYLAKGILKPPGHCVLLV